jgi:hypothetical protein
MSDTAGAGFWSRFQAAPLVLRAYLVFSAIAGILALSVFFARPFGESLLKYTGWMGLYFYLMTLIPAWALILNRGKKDLQWLVSNLALMIVFGLIDSYHNAYGPYHAGPDDTNPYLAYHPYRPLVTIALPAAWMLLVLSPLGKRWKASS